MSYSRVLGILPASLVVYGLYKIFRILYRELTSPLRLLPGPRNNSWLYGNIRDMWKKDSSVLLERWIETYGPTIQYKGLFTVPRLFTVDTKAVNHIIMNDHIYQKPAPIRYNLSRMLGAGILSVEGNKHRQQRKIMNPAFGPVQIRELTKIFMQKALQLRDIWVTESNDQGGIGRIDALSWLSRTTFDVIGLAGFNYQFNALNETGEPNELNHAFNVMFQATNNFETFPMLQAMLPPLRLIKTSRDAKIKKAREIMDRVGNQLIASSKTAIESSKESIKADDPHCRDLLSLLVRANMATGTDQKISDEDVLAQIPTFLVAGHETTSTGTTWALYALTQHPGVQTKLRNELLTVATDMPSMDELNALPYLDYVVRETMRIHAPVASVIRVAICDDIIPLGQPYTDTNGDEHHMLRIKKGQVVIVPILAINRSKTLWGEDALEFRPERWQSPPESIASVPGVWGNLMTFFGGPRSCIGYRFSLAEMKALLFTLVRAFEFELAVPATDIGKKSTVVQRPILLSDPDGGYAMPLLIKPYTSY